MNNKEQTRMAYNAIAKQYYELYKDDKTDLMYFNEFLDTCGNEILDLGCGMGHYANYMQNKGFNVTGVDFSSGMLDIARDKYQNVNYIEEDVCDLSFLGEKKYDGIVLAYLLQHISKEEGNGLINDLLKHLKPHAKLLILTREGNRNLKEPEPFEPRFIYEINEYNQETITTLLNNNWSISKIEIKDPVDDEYSVSPNTLVVMATYKG